MSAVKNLSRFRVLSKYKYTYGGLPSPQTADKWFKTPEYFVPGAKPLKPDDSDSSRDEREGLMTSYGYGNAQRYLMGLSRSRNGITDVNGKYSPFSPFGFDKATNGLCELHSFQGLIINASNVAIINQSR